MLSLSALRAVLRMPGDLATEGPAGQGGQASWGAPWPIPHLQRVQVWQPDAVPPAQVPPKVVVADVHGFQVPGFVPEEVQHIDGLQHRRGRILTTGTDHTPGRDGVPGWP